MLRAIVLFIFPIVSETHTADRPIHTFDKLLNSRLDSHQHDLLTI